MPPLLVQQQPRSPMVEQLAQALVQRGPMPVYGPVSAAANVLGPMAGAGIGAFREHQGRRESRAQMGQLERMLAAAAEAESTGGDRFEAIRSYAAEHAGEPGMDEVSRAIYQQELARMLEPTAGKQTPAMTNALAMNLEPGSPEYNEYIRNVTMKSEGVDPLVKVYDPSSPTGTSLVPRSTAAGRAGPATSGMDVEYDPDTGLMRVSTGVSRVGGGTSPLTKTNVSKVQGKLIDTADVISGIQEIKSLTRPEYLTWPERGKQMWNRFKARAGMGLSPEDRQQMADYSRWRASAAENAALTVNRLSGAAVSPAEFDRLEGFLPIESDDPITFASKLDRLHETATLAAARYNYFLNQGIPTTESEFAKLPLGRMKNIMQDRGQELYRDAKAMNPEGDDTQWRAAAAQQLKAEFGI